MGTARACCGDLGQLQMFHQAVHPSGTGGNAIITLKDISGFVGAEALVVIRINMKNQGGQALVLLDAGRGFCGKMLIISAAVYP